MKGSYAITVSNAKLRYDFTIRRNITIIKGNSATGKTTLVEMIREYYESGEDSGIHLKCEKSRRFKFRVRIFYRSSREGPLQGGQRRRKIKSFCGDNQKFC